MPYINPRKRLVGRIMAGLSAASVAVAAVPATAVSETPQQTASFNGTVRAVLYAGATLYVGGDFTQATDSSGTETRNHVAAVNVRTGQLLDWNPNANGTVQALAVSGERVYLGGAFSKLQGQARSNLAAVAATGRGRLSSGFGHRTNGAVNALAVRGSQLFVGGEFTRVNGRSRSNLAAFDVRKSTLLRWRPSANGPVLALATDRKRVYVAGSFKKLNGMGRHAYLGAVDRDKGNLNGFNPPATFPFLALDLSGNALYAAGDGPGGHLVKYSTKRGARKWTVATNGGVQAVTVMGSRVYAAGHFGAVCRTARVRQNGSCADGSTQRRKMMAVRPDNKRLLGWSPEVNSFWGIRSMDAQPTRGLVAAGGDFTDIRTGSGTWEPMPHLAQFG